jgi:FkbM family methyltransferase
MSTLKEIIWKSVAKGSLGPIMRPFGNALRRHENLLGLRNPLHMQFLTTIQADNLYVSELDSHMSLGAATKKMIRFDTDQFEDEISFLMKRLVKPDAVVLDIGANNGFHTVLLAKGAHRGHVYAFEPLEKFAAQASMNCALNGVDNVTIVNCALGAEEAVLDMWVNVAGEGLQGTSTFINNNANVLRNPDCYEIRKVPIKRLDDVIRTLDLQGPIRLVKIDTEGFDTMVLEGGMETIRAHKPVMFVEAHTTRLAQANKSWRWYLDTFADYHILIIHSLTRAKPYLHMEPLTDDLPEISVNLLLLPRRTFVRPGA